MATRINAISTANCRCVHLELLPGNLLPRNDFHKNQVPVADRGHDAQWFRDGPRSRGAGSSIPNRRRAKRVTDYGAASCAKRHRVENFFARLRDWRRIATRCDCSARNFPGAAAISYLL